MLRPHTGPSASAAAWLPPSALRTGPRCGPCCASCRCATPYRFSWRRRRRGRPPRSSCPRARARRSDASWQPASRLASRRRFLRIRIPPKTLSSIHGVATFPRIHPPLDGKTPTPPQKKIQGIKTKIQTGHLHKTVDDTLQVNPSRNVRRIRNRRNSHFLKYRRVLFSKIQFILPSRRNSSRAPDRSIREFNSPICRRNQVVVCTLAYFRLKRTLPTKAHREQF